MDCPQCKYVAELTHTHKAPDFYGTYRYYKCSRCKIKFKSSEKVIFTSLPQHIKEHFLSEGKRP